MRVEKGGKLRKRKGIRLSDSDPRIVSKRTKCA